MLLDVIRVKAYPDHTLWLEFENGEIRYFDMAPYMNQSPWVRLKAHNAFFSARVDNGTVAWNGNIDIDPETLYELSAPWKANRVMEPAGLSSHSTNTQSTPASSSPATSPASATASAATSRRPTSS
jgi:hypothetical protein